MEASKAIGNISEPPRYTEVIESLVGTQFFPDEERQDSLYDDFASLDPADIGCRALAYIQGLRILAVSRWHERSKLIETGESFPDPKAWSDKWGSKITIGRLEGIARANSKKTAAIRNELNIINGLAEPGEEPPEELFPLQSLYADNVITSLGLPFRPVTRPNRDGELETYHVNGVLAVGPTGFGKTAVMGEIARKSGIGQPLETNPSQRKIMLIVVPSTQLADQFAGLTGDNTFIRFFRNDRVSSYHAQRKDQGGDTIVTTVEQYVAGFRNNCFFGVPVHLLAFDEAHHLTQPRVEEIFLNERRGPTMGFTATPDYNKTKNASAILPHTVCHIDMLGSIDAKITNGAQLFTVFIDCNDIQSIDTTPRQRRYLFNERRDEAIVEFLTPLLAEGRRVMSFCDAGQQAENAIKMADRLSEVELPNGNRVTAEAIHSYRPPQGIDSARSVLRRYHSGETQALTSVKTGIESLNAAIDVITINSVYSYLKIRQQLGRGTRPSETYPITIYAQFITPHYNKKTVTPYTIYQAVGLERIEQGKVIQSRNQATGRRILQGAVDMSFFSEELQRYMNRVNFKTIGEVMLGTVGSQEIPPDFIHFDLIPRGEKTSAGAARARLDTAGYTWKGRYEPGTQGMVRYYEPAAATFFLENPMAPRCTEDFASIGDIADLYNITYLAMRRIIEKTEIPTTLMMGKATEGIHIHKQYFPEIEEIMNEKMPLKQPGDISVVDLAAEKEVSVAFLHLLGTHKKIRSKYRRDPTASNPRDRTKQLLSKEQADIFRAEIDAYPHAEENDKIKTDILRELGIKGVPKLNSYLTEEEKAQLVPKWTRDGRGSLRLLDNWSEQEASAIVARLKNELQGVLPPHLLPHQVTDKLFDVQAETVLRKLQLDSCKPFVEKVKLGFDKNRKHYCIRWPLLERFYKYYFDLRPDALKIDFSNLPTGPEDQDPERIAYARFVQATLVPADLLDFDPSQYLEKK